MNKKTILRTSAIVAAFSVITICIIAGDNGDKNKPVKRYSNKYNTEMHGFRSFIKWRLGLAKAEKPVFSEEETIPYRSEAVTPDYAKLIDPGSGNIQVTWLGHAGFLIQGNGINILTDPVLSKNISPVSFIGPERYIEHDITVDKLPKIDLVLISHNHYDHLDEGTILKLDSRTRFIVPTGIKKWFDENNIGTATELGWWESFTFRDIEITSVPAEHFSGRTLWDRNKTLWCGYVIKIRNQKIYFAGDTGYSPIFKEIKMMLGPVDLSLIPIGSYSPRWFMKNVHVNPPEAVKIHIDMNSKMSIGMHWGTFKMSSEPIGEPPLYLAKALQEQGIPSDRFITMKIGETFFSDQK